MPEPKSHARHAVDTTTAGALGAGSFVLGLLAAPLPPRWRRAIPVLEASAYADAAVPSAVLQAVAAIGLLALGFVAWMHGQVDAIDAKADATGAVATLDETDQKIVGAAMLGMNPVLPLIFALTTLQGQVLLTAFFSGTARLLHCAITREVMPDPVLGLIDWSIRRLQGKVAHERREKSKDRSPDRMIIGGPGDAFLIAIETAAEFDWREGNTVIVAGEWYRLKSRRELTTAAGLRQRYELEKMPTGVAIRGMRRYDPGHAPTVESSQPAGG